MPLLASLCVTSVKPHNNPVGFIVPILQVKKQKPREVKSLLKSQTSQQSGMRLSPTSHSAHIAFPWGMRLVKGERTIQLLGLYSSVLLLRMILLHFLFKSF